MAAELDMDKIARGLRAERRGKVRATGGYFGAMQLADDVSARCADLAVVHPHGMGFTMVKVLEQAIAELSSLSETDQEQIGRHLLSHVEKLRQLRVEIDKGLRSLDAGEGKPLDIDDFLQQQNQRHGRS